ncbi:uncharacterized protein BDR25DRAFT_359480 [Lindgomyces ingoldianus]|uniref:Uncharacterized protein n=1 Tax=Lindgomyces ingoldianus TaxID=673940 RepID=A0ACB6QJ94_9PLEO|nr:uncharacterized protein BDR25DRAFT_359480 [Lindgomyces ingoldianus]KAF2466585.1 hypothetical protein BDR25DRAFT_359480 [Lindgomyces ingoldianus]
MTCLLGQWVNQSTNLGFTSSFLLPRIHLGTVPSSSGLTLPLNSPSYRYLIDISSILHLPLLSKLYIFFQRFLASTLTNPSCVVVSSALPNPALALIPPLIMPNSASICVANFKIAATSSSFCGLTKHANGSQHVSGLPRKPKVLAGLNIFHDIEEVTVYKVVSLTFLHFYIDIPCNFATRSISEFVLAALYHIGYLGIPIIDLMFGSSYLIQSTLDGAIQFWNKDYIVIRVVNNQSNQST